MMTIREHKGFDAATCWANFDRAERETDSQGGRNWGGGGRDTFKMYIFLQMQIKLSRYVTVYLRWETIINIYWWFWRYT